jgi:hypothetical protein
MLAFLFAAQLLFQASAPATKDDLGLSWTRLATQERCDLLRSLLDSAKTSPARHTLFKSTCIREKASSKGRIVVNARTRWDRDEVRHVERFPGGRDGSTGICGWSDFASFEDLDERETTAANGLWQLMISFYPTGNATNDEFAFWAQLAPTWPLPPNSGASSGCPPEYGFVQRSRNTWTVNFDRTAKEYVPLSPALRKKKSTAFDRH